MTTTLNNYYDMGKKPEEEFEEYTLSGAPAELVIFYYDQRNITSTPTALP
jgi:hypothetical protein